MVGTGTMFDKALLVVDLCCFLCILLSVSDSTEGVYSLLGSLSHCELEAD